MQAANLTYQLLPQWLLKPVLQRHLSLVEATELWDHYLAGEGEYCLLPAHLWPAAQRLYLAECRPANRRQH